MRAAGPSMGRFNASQELCKTPARLLALHVPTFGIAIAGVDQGIALTVFTTRLISQCLTPQIGESTNYL